MYFLFCRWYFGKIRRVEAEKKLLLPENEHGSFLIRDSESRKNDYSLSGKCMDIVMSVTFLQTLLLHFLPKKKSYLLTVHELYKYSPNPINLVVFHNHFCFLAFNYVYLWFRWSIISCVGFMKQIYQNWFILIIL